jgi:hypothetical protein
MPPEPHNTYRRLLDERQAEIMRSESRHRTLGYAQLAAAIAAVAAIGWAISSRGAAVLWVFPPAVAFIVLLIVHDRLLKQTELRRRAARYFERALARLDGQWMGAGETGERYLDADHPYALDLDLFGKGSLFQLLSTARTHIGEDTLARWLLAPAAPEEIRERQAAVEELRPRLDLREDLAVLAEEARTGVDPISLAAWGEAPALLKGGRFDPVLWLFTILGLLGLVALLLYFSYNANLIELSARGAALARDVFLAALLVNGAYLYSRRPVTESVVAAVEEAAHELRLFSQVLFRLEREHFHSTRLAALRASLDAGGESPSRRIARLDRLIDLLDSRDNVFVRVAEIFVLWTPHLAVQVEKWRRESGAAVRRWLTATGEIEALCSFASHAFEHPADPFPELAADGAFVEAQAIGHPLIPEDRVVRNDLQIGAEAAHVLVVSGSNMSGKSTMLRTVGVNTVLAQAGAPVRAERMRLSPLAVGASIRVTDSLQEGVSRFYAEILRLRQIVQKPGPVLFLIDEFLHGTNSHDRRIGAEALVRRLVGKGDIGLITTHDLALADIVDSMEALAANVHFEDQIADGQIHFDYRMRPGVVRKSNAIELMRSVGLEV